MPCRVLKSIAIEHQTFVVCADAAGTLRLAMADASGCCGSNSLAEARLNPQTGHYAVVEHDVYVAAVNLMQDEVLRGECDDEPAAVALLSSLVH